jgi:glycosyltransferase involved in cell wall biosynthesis
MKTCKKDKMKIAYVCHKGDTYGGFVSHTEHAIHGLKKRGHDVDFFFLSYSGPNEMFVRKKIDTLHKEGVTIEGKHFRTLDRGIGTGLYNHIQLGWITPVTPYKTLQQKKILKEKLETYDVVIWHTPFWFKQKPVLCDTDWPMLLDLQNPVNVAFHHDANIRDNSAWMFFIDKYFDRLINVHQASYNSSSVFETPRTLIFNPQIINKVEKDFNGDKKVKFFSLQYWKGSKHVDDLIRAIPHLKEDILIRVAGNGLDYRYLKSIDKCPEDFIGSPKRDPDILESNIGRPIFNIALETGKLEDLNWVTEQERNSIFEDTDFFVDTAWYKVSTELGEHFSRTLVEAMIRGIVPIARNLGLSNNLEGNGEVFKAGENYIMIPYNATPKEFAEILDGASKISSEEYRKIQNNNFELLKHFDLDYVVEQYEKVFKGEPCGFYGKYETGGTEIPEKFLQKAEKQWFGTGDHRTFKFKKEKND